jgi:SRSO17 transposase
VWTTDDLGVAAGARVDPARWQAGFDELMGRVAGRFARVEPRRRARAFLLGLLAGLPRTNCWTLAEHAGDASPDGMQHLLARARWDADAVRDDLRGYVTDHLGDQDAVLVVDETGDVKKGRATVGVQRQYTGTAGRVENAQVAVYLVYAADRGHAFLDRALYLPRSWVDDPERREAGGVPEQVGFATKPALARRMLGAAFDAGVPASWVAGDEVYGADPGLRADLHERGVGYVLAVAANHRVQVGTGAHQVRDLTRRLPAAQWQVRSAGHGAKGTRLYEWAWLAITGGAPGHHSLLVRRNSRTAELAFYRCYSPRPVPLTALVQVAGRRWTVEESFQAGKGLAALDEHQVRGWTSWHRATVLSMLAHAFLAVMAATEPATTGQALIPLTLGEIRHLFTRLLPLPGPSTAHTLHWSRWRRRHQHRARASHYRRQSNTHDHELRLEY